MLNGKNVVLRPLEREDLIQLKHWRNSEELRPNTREFRPLNDVNQQRWFESLEDSSLIMFAIENTNEELVGCCGLTYIDWKNGNAEISIYIGKQDGDEKICTVEAMNILLRYGFRDLRFHRLYVIVFEYNKKNIELADNCGFILE